MSMSIYRAGPDDDPVNLSNLDSLTNPYAMRLDLPQVSHRGHLNLGV